MSESKTTCPFCQRPPGGIHTHECSRSRATTRQTAFRMRELAQPRRVWQFGPQVVFVPGKGNQITYNPGVPYVNLDRGKPWKAGGVPVDMDAKQRAFINHMKDTQARLRAQKETDNATLIAT